MKKENSNSLFVIIFLIIIGVSVFFLPEINELLFMNNSNNKDKNGTYTCTLKKQDNILDAYVSRKAVFTIEDGKMVKYTFDSTYNYEDIIKYNNKKNEKINKVDGITVEVSSDDANMVYTKKIKADVKNVEANNLDFPIKQAELENYVSNKGYKCSY